MTGRALTGAVIGAAVAAGALLIGDAVSPRGRTSLAVRLQPYIGGGRRDGGGTGLLARLGPFLARVLGGEAELARHLAAAGRSETVAAFRARQAAAWAAVAGAVGGAVGILRLFGVPVATAGGTTSAMLVGLAGPVALQVRLRTTAARRRLAVEVQLPALAGLLALCLSAGETVRSAIERSGDAVGGVLGAELRRVGAEVRGGVPLADALRLLADRVDVPAVSRLVDTLEVARQRGAPVAEVLRAQAGDLRASAIRRLIEVGGRRQVLMLAPVVFLILPVCLLFALYPALVSLQLVSR